MKTNRTQKSNERISASHEKELTWILTEWIGRKERLTHFTRKLQEMCDRRLQETAALLNEKLKNKEISQLTFDELMKQLIQLGLKQG